MSVTSQQKIVIKFEKLYQSKAIQLDNKEWVTIIQTIDA